MTAGQSVRPIAEHDMTITLSPTCTSLTGSLGQGFGYHIQRRGKTFCGVRQSRGYVPRDGHLRFIFACAELAKMGLHVTGIRVSGEELREACHEAFAHVAEACANRPTYNADDIINFKRTFSL